MNQCTVAVVQMISQTLNRKALFWIDSIDSFEAMVHPRFEAQKSYVKSNDLPSCLCTMSNHSLWPWKPPRYKLVLGPASPSTQHLSSGGYVLEEVEAGWHPNIARPLEKWEYHSEREIYIYIIEYIILYFIYTGNMMAIQWDVYYIYLTNLIWLRFVWKFD